MCSYGLDMSSTAKKRANRRNGARSRGPTSAEGKARSAQNRFLYAIDARAFVAVGEDPARFRDLARMVLEAFRPQTRFERLLVHRLCSQLWQRERLLRMERAMLGDGQAAAALPDALRQSAMAGASVERLAGLLELEIKLDEAGQILKINDFTDSVPVTRPMDMEVGPDGRLYILEWGSNFNGGSADARLVRVDFLGSPTIV